MGTPCTAVVPVSLSVNHEDGLVTHVEGLNWVNSARDVEPPSSSGVGMGKMITNNLPKMCPLRKEFFWSQKLVSYKCHASCSPA